MQAEHDPEAKNKSPTHDPDVLSHMYDIGDMNTTFEVATAPAECICSRPGCRICFPPRVSEFGPPVTNSEVWLVAGPKRVSEKDHGVEVPGSLKVPQRSLSEKGCGVEVPGSPALPQQ